MLITTTSLNPTASFGTVALLSQLRWRASQLCGWVRWGQMCLSVWGIRDMEKEMERKQRRREKKRGERGREREREREREKEADGARGRNVVAACQLLIRALVCPLWVGVRD